MRENFDKIGFETVTVFGKKCLFTDIRVDRETVPQGKYMYEIRHSDEDWGLPVSVGPGVLVNFFGTVVSDEPLLDESGEERWFTFEKEVNGEEYPVEFGWGYAD